MIYSEQSETRDLAYCARLTRCHMTNMMSVHFKCIFAPSHSEARTLPRSRKNPSEHPCVNMPLGIERLNARTRQPNDRIVFIKPLPGPDQAFAQDYLERIAAICNPIMKANHLAVMSLEEYEPNLEFVGRNFNAGEVIQLVLKAPYTGHWLPFRHVQMVMMHELSHCKQMNHSAAFWKVRNQYAGELRELWAKVCFATLRRPNEHTARAVDTDLRILCRATRAKGSGREARRSSVGSIRRLAIPRRRHSPTRSVAARSARLAGAGSGRGGPRPPDRLYPTPSVNSGGSPGSSAPTASP